MTSDDDKTHLPPISIKVSHLDGNDLPESHAREVLPFQIKLEIENTTNSDILVSLRNGITYAVYPSARTKGNDVPGILIRHVLSLDKHKVKIDVRSQLNDPRTEELKIISSSVLDAKFNTVSKLCHGVEYFVEQERLENSGGILYIANCDIQISNLTAKETPEHPFSRPGVELHSISDNDFLNSKNSVGMSIKLVDNSSTLRERFINLGGNIFVVKPVTDVTLQDGLYVVLNGVTVGGSRTGRPKAKYFSFEEMDTVFGGLYKTLEEALALGDLFKQGEKERNIREQELKNDKLNIQKQLQELERKNLEAKAELESLAREKERLRHERELSKMEYDKRMEELQARERELEHKRKMDSMRRDDYYDERNHQRKDISETTKLFLQITAQVVIGIVIPYLIKTSK